MSSPGGTVRHRNNATGSKKKDALATGIAPIRDEQLDELVKANLLKRGAGPEWDYRIALAIITILAFITRFWGISHPNEVVFDEVHFGKVGEL
jgi:dolichyl-phosphate-mannose-protein mannosyltransferase